MALPERVEFAPGLVADSGAAALGARAQVRLRGVVFARVRRQLGGGRVGFPEVHLRTAVAVVGQVGFCRAVCEDEGRFGTLRVAVACSVCGARGVGGGVVAAV